MRISVETKFEIGDMVKLRGALAQIPSRVGPSWLGSGSLNGPVVRMLVEGIDAVTCPAGTQIIYVCVPFNDCGEMKPGVRLNEVLLEKSEPFIILELDDRRKAGAG